MQKKLIVAAVAGALAAPLAFAQSAVQITGYVAWQVDSVSGSGASYLPVAAADRRAFDANKGAIQSRMRSTDDASNIRFNVTEDLGGGMKAYASLPIYFTADCSAALTNSCGLGGFGATYVGIGGGWGDLRFGKIDVHYASHITSFDNFYPEGSLNQAVTGLMSQGLGGTGFTAAAAAGNATGPAYGAAAGGRLSSVLQYMSPNFNGFSGHLFTQVNSGGVAAGLGNNFSNASNVAGNNAIYQADFKNVKMWAGTLYYTGGPIKASLSIIQQKNLPFAAAAMQFAGSNNNHNDASLNGLTAATALTGLWTQVGGNASGATVLTGAGNATVNGTRLGAQYAINQNIKVGMVYESTKNDVTFNTDNGAGVVGSDTYNVKRTVWALPVNLTYGKHDWYLNYAKAGDLSVGGSVVTNVTVRNTVKANFGATGARQMIIGYKYALGRRTKLVASYSKLSNDDRAGYDYRAQAGVGMNNFTRGADLSSAAVGIYHSF